MTLKCKVHLFKVFFLLSCLSMLKRTLEYGRLLPPKVLGSMLRLGRKYGIATFEDAALESLHHDCPTTLFEWDSGSEHRKIDFRSDDNGPEDVISIAHEFRLFTTLPAAYTIYLKYRGLVTFFSHTWLFFSLFLWTVRNSVYCRFVRGITQILHPWPCQNPGIREGEMCWCTLSPAGSSIEVMLWRRQVRGQ